MLTVNQLIGFGSGGGGPLDLVGSPTLLLQAENYNGSTWANTGSLGATGNFSGGVSPTKNAADGNFNGKASVGFDGTMYLTSAAVLSQCVANNAKTVLVVYRVASANADATISTTTGALIIGDNNAFWAFGDAAGARMKNFDGSADYIVSTISTGIVYGVQGTHDGVNLELLRSGASAETPVASGNTSDLTNAMALGGIDASGPFFNGTIGLIAVWNTVLSAGDLTLNRNAVANFYNIAW